MDIEKYDSLPIEIKEVLNTWNDEKNLYKECERIKKELNKIGWDCEYGLDGTIEDVIEIDFKIKLTKL